MLNQKILNIFEVNSADHSFKDPETKEPVYVDETMKVLSKLN